MARQNATRLLAQLVRQLQQPLGLEELLSLLANRASEVLGVPRVNVRVLDPTRTMLLASARAGAPLHKSPPTFQLGQGLVGWVAKEVTPLRLGRAEEDPRFEKRPDMVDRLGSFLGVPIVSNHNCIGVLSATTAELDHFTDEDEDLLVVLSGLAAPQLEVARLSRLAHIDPLTGAFNRRGLDAVFPPSITPSEPTSIALLDVDHFKRVNDTWGHAVGDDVLRRVAETLAGVVRPIDAVIRYGGEEFMLILRAQGIEQAVRTAERVREAIETTEIFAGDQRIRVTASIGVAEVRAHEARDEAIKRADLALMDGAKAAGRNRVARAS